MPGTHHLGVPDAVCDKLQARVLVLAAERAEAVLRARQVTSFLPGKCLVLHISNHSAASEQGLVLAL